MSPAELFKVEPLKAEYRDRDARIAVADAQGLDAVLLFPTLGCGVEEALRHDIPATMASLSAFNRWLEEDWGFSYRDRLIGVPMLSLADPDAALAELNSLIERGARIVHIRPAPVPGPNGTGRSLGDSAARPGVGAARRGVDSRRVPPRRQRLQRLRRRLGRQRNLRGVRRHGRPEPSARLGPGHPRHDGQPDHRRRVPSPSRAAGREHRERIRLGAPAGQAPAQAGEPDAVDLPRGSPRHGAQASLGDALPRGGPARAGRSDRRGANPVRIRLAPRRGARPADGLRAGALGLQRGRAVAGSCATTVSSCSGQRCG